MDARLRSISIVVPVLDEAGGLAAFLESLQGFRQRGHQVIVADGGSGDGSSGIARALADNVVVAARGRAIQMNAGAAAASGDALLFLHADTRLPAHADRCILDALARACWGRFDVRIEGRSRALPFIAAAMNLRSRLTGIATGDQAMFMRRDVFERLGGFAPIPLMEDIEMSRRLKRAGAPACLSARVTTSGRRWDDRGAIRTVLLMWGLRGAFWLGADPAGLARRYR